MPQRTLLFLLLSHLGSDLLLLLLVLAVDDVDAEQKIQHQQQSKQHPPKQFQQFLPQAPLPTSQIHSHHPLFEKQ
ncbi:MAG: hypothetical protein J3R72DRAFT_453368 [Linnemannia gamsii]|nr:MAG: hypothetical protein J3R72DRAFT_453368 [Linnemannia gamsii]